MSVGRGISLLLALALQGGAGGPARAGSLGTDWEGRKKSLLKQSRDNREKCRKGAERIWSGASITVALSSTGPRPPSMPEKWGRGEGGRGERQGREREGIALIYLSQISLL